MYFKMQKNDIWAILLIWNMLCSAKQFRWTRRAMTALHKQVLIDIITDLKSQWGFPVGVSGKEPACQCRRHKRCEFDPWVGKILWRKAWQPIPVFLPGESHGQRSLAGYSPWVHKKIEQDWSNLACMRTNCICSRPRARKGWVRGHHFYP